MEYPPSCFFIVITFAKKTFKQMNIDERMEQSKTYGAFRTSLDIGMGAIYVIIGIIVFSVRYFGVVELSSTQAWILGSAMVLYGGFRIYRGTVAIWQRKKPRRQQD